MGGGPRYSPYHIYQNLRFPEVNRARTVPYTGEVYQCPHSQRGFQPNYQTFAERNFYDAANTTCCDETAGSYRNKQQYRGIDKPWTPNECPKNPERVLCDHPEMGNFQVPLVCADVDGTASPGTVRAKCPQVCDDLKILQQEGYLTGLYGVFYLVGMFDATDMLLRYAPDASTLTTHFKECEAPTAVTEEICGGAIAAKYYLGGGMDPNTDCQCDCCNDYGDFGLGAPIPVFTENVPANDWVTTLNLGVTKVDEACKGADITGTWDGVGDDVPVTWYDPVTFYSNGTTTRYVQGTATAGYSASPACCGGTVWWDWDDGCGTTGTPFNVIASMAPTGTAPAFGAAPTYENTLSAEDLCTNMCPTGSMTGSSSVGWDWTSGPTYDDNTGNYCGDADVGDSSSSACCGGNLTIDTEDGCGGTDQTYEEWASAVSGTPAITPADGEYSYSSFVITCSEVCSYASAATISAAGTCMTAGSITRTDGQMQVTLTPSAESQCTRCCAEGDATATCTDGCGNSDGGSWTFTDSFDGGDQGQAFKCLYADSGYPYYWVYYPQFGEVLCNDSGSVTWHTEAIFYLTSQECDDHIYSESRAVSGSCVKWSGSCASGTYCTVEKASSACCDWIASDGELLQGTEDGCCP